MELPENKANGVSVPRAGDPAFESAMDDFVGASKPLTFVPEAKVGDMDAVAADIKQDKTAQLQNSFNQSLIDANPEREAEVQSLARESGLPAAAIRQNFDEVKRQRQSQIFKQADLVKRFPHTAQFMSSGDNAALVTDDYQNLQAFESLLKPSMEGPSGGVAPNVGRQVLGVVPRINQQLYGIGADVMGFGDDFIGQPFTDVTGLELFFGHAEKWLRDKRDQTKAVADGIVAPVQGAGRIEGALMNATQSVTQQIPGLAATVLTRNPAYALGWAGTTTGLQSYDQAREQGLLPMQALRYGIVQGTTEAAFERIPLFHLMNDLKVGSSLGKTIFHQLLTEIPSEAATTTVQNFNEWAMLNPDKPFSTYLAQLPSDLVDTVLATTMSVGFQTSAMHALNNYAFNRDAVTKSNEQVAFLSKMNDLANATQLRQRDVKSFEQFVGTAAADSPVKEVFIDGNALAQSGVDISGLSDDVKKQVAEAKETGGTVRIPVEQYAARIAGAEGADGLLDHLKLSPTDMSRAEAEVYMQEEGAQLQAEVEKVLATRQADQTFMDSKNAVQAKVLEQLSTANRFTDDVNSSYAMLASSFYAVQANRLGITPEEMFQRYPMRVQSTLGPGLSLADYRQTSDPDFKSFYADSVLKTPKGEPLRLYHGTGDVVDEFDLSHPNRKDTGWLGEGVYLTDRVEVANIYAANKAAGKKGGSANVMPLYARITKPYLVNDPVALKERLRAGGKPAAVAFTAQLQNQGHDGLIATFPDGTREIVAFDPAQVKSVLNQNPTETPGLYKQETRPSEETIKRDSLGFYSQLAKEVVKMNLPAWKPLPAKALSSEEKTELASIKSQLTDIAEDEHRDLVGTLWHPQYQEYQQAQRLLMEAQRTVFNPATKTHEPFMNAEEKQKLNDLIKKVHTETAEREKKLIAEFEAQKAPLKARLEELAAKDRASLGLASGKDIWAKIKSLPVKKEELEWVGIEDYLKTKDKFAREEVLEFINSNGVKVDQTVADVQASEGDLNFDSGEVWDADEAWNHDLDYHKEMVDEEDGETIEGEIVDELIYAEASSIRENFPADQKGKPLTEVEVARLKELRDMSINSTTHPDYKEYGELLDREIEAVGLPEDLTTDPKVVEWVKHEYADTIREKKAEVIEERATERARDQYQDNPIYIYHAETADGTDVYIFGNDDQGYSVCRDSWEQHENTVRSEIYSFGEAQIQAIEWAWENGHITDEGDESVAKWGDYVMGEGQAENYREIKLKLPDIQEDFYNDTHFPDRNIVAFLRVDDRYLPSAPGLTEQRKQKSYTPAPDTYANLQTKLKDAVTALDNSNGKAAFDAAVDVVYPASVGANGESIDDVYRANAMRRWNESPADRASQVNTLLNKLADDSPVRAPLLAYAQLTNLYAALQDRLDEVTDQHRLRADKEAVRATSSAKTYFVDEFQSDWHQRGREAGYGGTLDQINAAEDVLTAANTEAQRVLNEQAAMFEQRLRSGDLAQNIKQYTNEPGVAEGQSVWKYNDPESGESSAFDKIENLYTNVSAYLARESSEFKAAEAVVSAARTELRGVRSDIPNAPFKDDGWIALGVKRAIVDAVEQGYEQIGWAGAQTVMSRWSERYSEAYTNQYDKKMPSLFKKLMKADPVKAMYNRREDYWVIPITDELRQRVKDEGFSLFQDKESIKRGAFTPSTNTVTLLKDADLSTFLHEFGHFMLEVQTDMASRPDAPKQVKDDMDALLKWYGIKGRNQTGRLLAWNKMTLEQKRKHHEKFARGFEAYLFEGKAPNPELRALFQRFRAWLVNVYRQLKNLNAPLTKDVRDVMDRMLATDAEISAAEEMQRFEPLFKAAEQAGMKPEEFLNYQQLGRAATANAIETLEARSMRDMQWLSNARASGLKKMQAKAESQRREVRSEVSQQVKAEPVYRAVEFLKRGTLPDGTKVPEGATHKISTKGAKEVLGEKRYSKLSGWFGKYGMLAEDGMHPDAAAELFGFKSGDHLLKALIKAEPMNEKIDGLTDQRMLERHGDLVDPVAVEQAVMSALANDTRAKFIAAEITALNNALGGRKFWAEAAKQYAEAMVNRQRIRDLRPAQYETAEAKAAKEAQKAFAKADLEVAAAQKRNQLVNLYAAKGARQAVEDVNKGLRYLKKFDKARKKGSPKIDADYRDQIDALLEQYLLKPVTNKEADRRLNLREWLDKQKEKGLEPDLPESIINDVRRRSYKEMSVEEFRGLMDTIKQIEHVGRAQHRLFTAKKQQDFEKAREEILTTITANAPGRKPNLRTRTNAGGAIKDMAIGYLAMHRKLASFLREMDGFKDGGPLWEYIIRPMNEAGDRENTMREKATIKLSSITEKLLKSGEVMGGKGTYFETIGKALNREERLSIALNLGNEGNTQRLLDGEGWTMEQLKPVLATLTKEDWAFVQEVWDYFESYRPLSAAKERRVYGREPEWVKPRPVETPFGTLKGGYFPIRYDPRATGKTKQYMKAEEAQQMMRGAFNASTTRRSYTKSRAEKVTGRPLLYSFNTIYQGTEEIIHDLTHHEWLIDATKFLRDSQFDKAIRENYGPEYVDLVQSAVDDIAKGYQPAQDVFERSVNHIRKGATVAGLGWNFGVSLLQPLGLTNSMVRIGPGWVGRGIVSWYKAPLDKVEEIYGKSEFMRLRAKTMQREINEIQNRLQTPGRIQTGVGKVVGAKNTQLAKEWMEWSMFLTIQKMQLVADVPTWLGQYEKSIAEGESDERASALADQAVIDSQGGGSIKDLSEIQRGGPMRQLWTNFYSYFNVVYNLNAEVKNRTDWRDPYQVAVAARDYMLLMVVPAILGKLLKDALAGDDDDKNLKKTAKALAAEQISYMMGTMVGLREVTAAAQRVAGVAQFNGSYGGPAGLRFLQELDKLGTQVSQGKLDRALRKSTLNTAGILFRLPSGQINRTWDGIEEMVDGNAGPLAILSGPPR